MNTELQAMIDAGRKLIAEQATAEAERLESIHLAKLPAWMHEYVTVTHWDHSVRIYLDLPGCAPIYADSVSWSDGFVQLGVANPLTVLFDDEGEDWYVTKATHSCHELETAVALAADTVRRIFSEFVGGSTMKDIAARLEKDQVPTAADGGWW